MNSPATSVKLDEIRNIMNAALTSLEAAGVEEVSLERDAYWSVYFEGAFDMTKQPQSGVDSLEEDLAELRDSMQALANDEGAAVWHMFHHLQGLVLLMASESRRRLI